MANKTTFFTSEYGERVILRRVFLPNTFTKEAVVLYTKLLNDFPLYVLKKPLSQLAGAQFSFSCYHYQDGYVIQGKLSQSQSSVLHYVFADPYKEAEKLFQDIFTQGYIRSEVNLAVAKERLLTESYLLNRSSAYVGKTMISATYSPLSFDRKLLMEVKAEELESVNKAVAKIDQGDSFLLGQKEKKGVLSLTPKYIKDMVLQEAVLTTNEVAFTYLDDESALLVLSHDKIETTGDKKTLEYIFAGIKKAIRNYLSNLVYIDYSMTTQVLDNTHSLLIISAPQGRLDSLLNRLPIRIGEGLFVDALACFEDAKIEYGIKQIKAQMSLEVVLKDMLEEKDLALKEEGEVSKESYQGLLSSFLCDDEILVRKENYDA